VPLGAGHQRIGKVSACPPLARRPATRRWVRHPVARAGP
jgi:hypothetical protein